MPSKSAAPTTPLFNWLNARAAGVLLHPTALPGDQGVGTFDAQAVRFLDFMQAAGLKYWQICPLGPTGYGDSPYQCFSAFAGNPYLIDLKALIAPGLLTAAELAPLATLNPERVDYGALYEKKWPLLAQAYARFKTAGAGARGRRRDLCPISEETGRLARRLYLRPSAEGPSPRGRVVGLAGSGALRTGLRRNRRSARNSRPRSRRTRFTNTFSSLSGGPCARRPRCAASRSSATFRSSSRRTRPMCGPTRSCSNSIPRRRGRWRWRACRRIISRPTASCGAIRSTRGHSMRPTATLGGMRGCRLRLSCATWCASTISAASTPTGGFPRVRRRRARASG